LVSWNRNRRSDERASQEAGYRSSGVKKLIPEGVESVTKHTAPGCGEIKHFTGGFLQALGFGFYETAEP
jgi:hypothetical protein